jgi:hypothetical protein
MKKETDRREPTDDEAREMLRKRLAETIRWCSTRGSGKDPAGSLRNSALKPGSFGGQGEQALPEDERHARRQETAEKLATARRKLVRQETFGYWKELPDLGGGRILLYEPDRSKFDGAAQKASKGLFDLNSAPPWDTWLCYFAAEPGLLLAWIPPELVPLAESGLKKVKDGSLSWAAEQEGELSKQLKEWGMLG